MENDKYKSLDDVDKETDKFIALYGVAYVTIIKILQVQINQGLNQRQAKRLLNQINKHLKNLDVEAVKYVKDVFPNYYYIALKDFDKLTASMNVKAVAGAEHAIHKKALRKAQNDLYKDLAKRTTFMSNQAKKIIRDNSKDLLKSMIESGTSYRTIKKELKNQLIKDGVSSFVDAGKRKWSIDRYSNMLIRTKSRILHNEGTINRLKEYQENSNEYNENFDLIQISEHGSDDWCSFYEGNVYSISGEHPYYPSVEVLPNRPYEILHPNCRHVWLPYIASLRGQGSKVDKQYENMSLSELNKIEYQINKDK